jgi:hypothetical protein
MKAKSELAYEHPLRASFLLHNVSDPKPSVSVVLIESTTTASTINHLGESILCTEPLPGQGIGKVCWFLRLKT